MTANQEYNTARATGLSVARLYKMAGNAVTVPVSVNAALGQTIKEIEAQSHKGGT